MAVVHAFDVLGDPVRRRILEFAPSGELAIAAGESREQALTAAESTRQFYTGEAPPPEM